VSGTMVVGLDSDDGASDTKIVNEKKRTAKKLHQLTPDTDYIVNVYASTSAGPGPSKTIVTKTTPFGRESMMQKCLQFLKHCQVQTAKSII